MSKTPKTDAQKIQEIKAGIAFFKSKTRKNVHKIAKCFKNGEFKAVDALMRKNHRLYHEINQLEEMLGENK